MPARHKSGMDADPTLASVAATDDPARYSVVRGVPVFKAHTRLNPDGTVKYRVTDADLPAIAASTNGPILAGNLPRVTPGHVFGHVAEVDQPAPLGVFKNARVGTFGPKRERAVLVDLYCRRELAAQWQKYPYRSAEYYPSERRIRGLALLVRDPALDLGATLYELDHPEVSYYSAGDSMDETTMPADETAAGAAVLGDAMYTAIVERLKADGYIADPEGDSEVNTGPGETPAMLQLVGQIKSQAKVLTALQAKANATECHALVSALQAEGYQLDPAYEIAALSRLDAAQRERHVANARKVYSRVPVGPGFELYQGPGSPVAARPDAPLTKDEFHAAARHRAKNGGSFAAAKLAVRATR